MYKITSSKNAGTKIGDKCSRNWPTSSHSIVLTTIFFLEEGEDQEMLLYNIIFKREGYIWNFVQDNQNNGQYESYKEN